MREMSNWDYRYLQLARFIAGWSKDPSTKVGAVITDPANHIVSMGFNGLPRGVQDSEERLGNRDLKYKMVVHAERNALLFAERSVRGCTLYTWPFMPCAACSSMIIQAGITRVVSAVANNSRWIDDFKLSRELFQEAGVTLIEDLGFELSERLAK